jgi:endo-1,4-beta-xylanase
MSAERAVSRRAVMVGAAAAGAAGLIGGASPAIGLRGDEEARLRPPLWQTALQRGMIYGSSTATWQISDHEYRRLFDREAAILFTEDDLLWYRLRPKPHSGLDFTYGDRIINFAERNRQLVFGAHLVWDEGFGPGWTDDDLWNISEKRARHLLYDTIRAEVKRYRGRIAAWSVANEVTDPEGRHGLRTNVPWYHTIGPSYVAEAFHLAHSLDPKALMVINEFGFETVNQYGDQPGPRRRATLQVIDKLLNNGVPVQALGVQAHLLAAHFDERFHPLEYRRFLSEVADRGLKILITEMDVLDDGLPANPRIRDQKIADVYKRYFHATLQEPAVISTMTFGLSDRYTWLDEDYPRPDGAHRRPLPFDRKLKPKPAYHALHNTLKGSPRRHPYWRVPRAHPHK